MVKIILSVLLVAILPILFGMGLVYSQCSGPNKAFAAGEKVTYHAYYNWHFIWMNAGLVTFSVDKAEYQNRPVFKLMSVGATYNGYDTFYKVRDTFVSVVDTGNLKPLLFHRKTNEGSYSAYETYRFNYANKTIASSISKENAPYVHTTVPLKDCTLDLLSMVYRARNFDFDNYRPNERIPIRMVVDGEVHDLYIRFLGREVISTRDNRKFRCLKFSPLLMEGTIFSAGEDMTVWVTDDRNRIPIIVEAKILVGSVKAMFVDVTGARYPLASEIK